MLYRFRSKSSADVIALQSSGEALLRAMGREPESKGIVEVDALAPAIRAIERAIESEEAAARVPVAVGVPGGAAEPCSDESPEGAPEAPVSLRRRAWPLLEMLRRARAEGHVVTWG